MLLEDTMDMNDSIPWKFLIPKNEFGEKFQQCIANGGNSEDNMITDGIFTMSPSVLIKILFAEDIIEGVLSLQINIHLYIYI